MKKVHFGKPLPPPTTSVTGTGQGHLGYPGEFQGIILGRKGDISSLPYLLGQGHLGNPREFQGNHIENSWNERGGLKNSVNLLTKHLLLKICPKNVFWESSGYAISDFFSEEEEEAEKKEPEKA